MMTLEPPPAAGWMLHHPQLLFLPSAARRLLLLQPQLELRLVLGEVRLLERVARRAVHHLRHHVQRRAAGVPPLHVDRDLCTVGERQRRALLRRGDPPCGDRSTKKGVIRVMRL